MFLIGNRVKIIKGNHKGEIGTIEAYDGYAFYSIRLEKAEKIIKYTKQDIEPFTEE